MLFAMHANDCTYIRSIDWDRKMTMHHDGTMHIPFSALGGGFLKFRGRLWCE